MRIVRLGRAPVKGMHHESLATLTVDAEGVVGDRAAAVVDASTHKVLKSAQNAVLLRVRGAVTGDEVRIRLPGGHTATQSLTQGEPVEISYWGRPAHTALSDGPAARALSGLLGRSVLLAAAPARRSFIWEAPVSVVCLSQVEALERRLDDPALARQLGRYRANVVLDDTDAPVVAGGVRLRSGEVELALGGPVDRCAVVNHHPDHAAADPRVLAAMGRIDPEAPGLGFGWQATVVAEGVLSGGATVHRVGDQG